MSMYARIVSLSLAAGVIGGCGAYPTVEEEFGDSVRHMVRSQTLNPGPADPEPVRQGDGQRADNALGVYRSGVSRPQQSSGQNVALDLGTAAPR